jgi:gliding motility-associated-like protein
MGSTVAWNWSFGEGNTTSANRDPSFTYAEAGDKTVQLVALTDGRCQDTLQRIVPYYPLPSMVPIDAQEGQGCLPEDAQFAVNYALLSTAYQVDWEFGDGGTASGASVQHTYTVAGNFTPRVRIQAPNGCQLDSTLAAVTIEEGPTAAFQYDPPNPSSLNSTVNFSDLSQGAQQWQWDFAGFGSSSDQNPIFMFPDSAGTYPVQLIVYHPNGCTDTTMQTITIQSIIDYYVPNAFSPNGDGANDEFRGFGPQGGRTDYEMAVFDRWGNRVFFSQNPDEGWNGRKNNTGEPLGEGVYVYYVTFIDVTEGLITIKGLVNLLR